MSTARPTLRAVVQAAVEATGAERGWLLAAAADDLTFVVAAAYGKPDAAALIGPSRARRGIAGFVFGSGQPAAVQLRTGDGADNEGAGGFTGVPAAVLAVPCGADEVRGVLELVNPQSGAFGFDDVDTASLLADIAGAALGEEQPSWQPPTPEQLGSSLAALAQRDPARYSEVARLIEAIT